MLLQHKQWISQSAQGCRSLTWMACTKVQTTSLSACWAEPRVPWAALPPLAPALQRTVGEFGRDKVLRCSSLKSRVPPVLSI